MPSTSLIHAPREPREYSRLGRIATAVAGVSLWSSNLSATVHPNSRPRAVVAIRRVLVQQASVCQGYTTDDERGIEGRSIQNTWEVELVG